MQLTALQLQEGGEMYFVQGYEVWVHIKMFKADSALLGLCICMWWELSPPTPLLLSRSLSHFRPPSPLSLQYLCSSVIPFQAGGRHTLMLFCYTCWLCSTAPLCLSRALFPSLQPVPPHPCHAAAAASPEQLMCLLPCCFTAIALPQFPCFHCFSCFLLPDNHGRVRKPHYRKTGRGRKERRGRPEHSSFQLLHSSVCPSQAAISCTVWTQYWEQLVGRKLPEGIYPHMNASIFCSFLGQSAEDRRGKD